MRKTRIGKRGASKVPCRQSGLGYDRPERREDVPGRGKGPATNASALPDPFVLCQAGNGDLYRHVGVVVHPWNLKAEHAVKILPIAVNVRQLLDILG